MQTRQAIYQCTLPIVKDQCGYATISYNALKHHQRRDHKEISAGERMKGFKIVLRYNPEDFVKELRI